MKDTIRILKSKSPKLVQFIVFVIIYFVFVRDPHGELWTTFLKCAPIVCLMFYVVANNFQLTETFKISQLILLGLVFSCVGDALLNIDMFPHGMGAFALAQICYIFAFGFKPLKWLIAAPLYVAGGVFVATIFKDLDDILVIGLPVYIVLLLTMCWRSLVRAVDTKCFFDIFCGIGSIFFVLSDGLIGVDMFLVKVPNARIWIMSTYYLAQFAIALSTTKESATKFTSGDSKEFTTELKRLKKY